MKKMDSIIQNPDVFVIEDAAHALGSSMRAEKK